MIETDSFTVDLAGKKATKDGAEVHHADRVGHAGNAGPQPRQVGRPRGASKKWGPAYD